MRFLFVWGFLIGWSLGGAGEAFADDMEAYRQQRAALWRQRLRLERLQSREGLILDEIERLDRRIQDLEEQKRLWQGRIKGVQEKLDKARLEYAIQKEIARASIEIMRPRMRLFYRVSRLGHGRILLGSKTLRAMALRWRLLRYLTARDLKMLHDYQAIRQRIAESAKKIAAEEAHLRGIVARIQDQQQQIKRFQEDKRAALQTIYQEADLYKNAVNALQQSRKDLKAMLQRQRVYAQKSGILARKGRIRWPIRGFTPYCKRFKLHIEGSFRALQCEEQTQQPQPLRTPLGRVGITLRIPTGTPILAVATGRVAYRGWRRGYGLVLILDHGQRFYTVYAHLSEALAEEKSLVQEGESIALSGASGSLLGSALYFEIRYPVRPLPPEDWLLPPTPPQSNEKKTSLP